MANIELDGANKKIKVDSGDLTLDVPGDIVLDADGGDVEFADGGTNILKVSNSSSDVVLQPQVDAKDIIFKQYDGTTVATVEDNATFNIPASKLAIGGTAVTSTAAELNILDGVTSTTAELNILDGVTSTTAELNILDGVTATASELNLLDGGTSVGSSITLADADGFVVNDGGTMKTIPASDINTYASGNLVKITSGTWGNGTDTLSLSNIFTTTYKHYIFYLTNVRPTVNAGVALQIETSGDGSYATGSSYHYVLTGRDSSGNLTNTQDNNASKIEFQGQAITGNNASKRGSYIIDIFDPMDSSCYTHVNISSTYHDSDGATEFNKGAGVYLQNTAVTGFRVLLSSGTIQTTGANYIVYGLAQ